MCIAKTFITATPYTYLAHDLEACQRYWWQNLLCEYSFPFSLDKCGEGVLDVSF
jgi:hypothetical protein